jgi:hypothetical protein
MIFVFLRNRVATHVWGVCARRQFRRRGLRMVVGKRKVNRRPNSAG